MPVHRYVPTHYHTALGPFPPVLRVEPDDTVITTTVDASGCDASGKRVTPGGNPQSGPFYVSGAEPGDTLVVRFDRLTPTRATGFSRTLIDQHTLDRAARGGKHEEVRGEWAIDRDQGVATLLAPETKLGQFSVPLAPMVGCFGVAPSRPVAAAAAMGLLRAGREPRGVWASRLRAVSTATAGPYGGNMDYRGFKEGVTVYLPVFVPGALFFVGDGHAAQGEGELLGTGIETSFEVEVTLGLRKGWTITWPRGETEEHIFTVGNARPLDAATRHATTEMRRWLLADYGFDERGAALLMGMCVEYAMGNVYDPAHTMVCKMSKKLLVDHHDQFGA